MLSSEAVWEPLPGSCAAPWTEEKVVLSASAAFWGPGLGFHLRASEVYESTPKLLHLGVQMSSKRFSPYIVLFDYIKLWFQKTHNPGKKGKSISHLRYKITINIVSQWLTSLLITRLPHYK